MRKDKLLNKKTFFNFIPKITKKVFNQQKGFSLIGVLVAAAIGLIVVGGISQLFINMSTQIKHVENRANLLNFTNRARATIEDQAACRQTLNDPNLRDNIWAGSSSTIAFEEIKNSVGATIADLSAANRDNLEADYGLTGTVYFALKCAGSSCTDCSTIPSTAPPTPCRSRWSIGLVTQSLVRGITIFNKPQTIIEVEVVFPDAADNTAFSCTGMSLGPVTPIVACTTIGDTGDERSLLGCGTTQNITERTTTAIGFDAGNTNVGAENTFVGYSAGRSTSGEKNTFLGYQAGQSTTTGNNNTFIGSQTGLSNISGDRNLYIGTKAGMDATGTENTFLGNSAGREQTTGDRNMFLGQGAGLKANGSGNVMLGERAGFNMASGDRNIFIGTQAGRNLTGVNDKFVIGNENMQDWISGDIGTDNIWVNDSANAISGNPGKRICLEDGTNCPTTALGGTPSHTHAPSSRTLKKKIKPFNHFQEALDNLLKTPLFTYQYKDKNYHPEKKRMGVISEELPEHLQILEKDKASQPDWPSIYGTFWAGIKALNSIVQKNHNQLKAFIKNFVKFQTNIKLQLKQIETKLEQSQKDLSSVKKELVNVKKETEELARQLAETQSQWKEFQDQTNKKSSKLKVRKQIQETKSTK